MKTAGDILTLLVLLGCLIGAGIMFGADVSIGNDTILGFVLLTYARTIVIDMRVRDE